MSIFRPRPAAAAVGVVLALAMALAAAVPGAARGAVTPPGGAVPPGGGAAAAAARTARTVTLITGNQVLVPAEPGGMQTPVAGGPAGAPLTLVLGGQHYEVPADALPFLGRNLDPRLFDPGLLAGAERGGRLPVTVTYRGRPPRLPGVTVIRAGAGTAHGYLTAASARVFGAALARQYLAGRARGGSGGEGVFASGVRIALARPARRAVARRAGHPTGRVTVIGTDPAGRPASRNPVSVVNVDNTRLFSGLRSVRFFQHGIARYTVPAGHYWAAAVYFGSAGHSLRLVYLPQFTVPAGGDVTVRADARTATSKITFVTPRPSRLNQTNAMMLRYPHRGLPDNEGATIDGPGPVYVTPLSHRPTVGSLRLYSSVEAGSPPGSRVPYQYVLSYAAPRGTVPAPLRYVVRPSSLATVDESFYQSSPAPGLWLPSDLLVPGNLLGAGPVGYRLALPHRDRLYAGTNVPHMAWQSEYRLLAPGEGAVIGQYQESIPLPAGHHLTGSWNRYPLHPDANVVLGPQPVTLPVMPSAARAGNTLRLNTTPFTDNQPGDTGRGFAWSGRAKITGSYQVDQNGRKIAGGNAVKAAGGADPLILRVPLHGSASRSSVIRFSLTASRSGPGVGLATASRTVWTWRSAGGPSATLPPSWYCWSQPGLILHRGCTVQPMMTLEYDVARLGLDESAPPGRQAVTVTAGHLQLARAARVTGAKVWASFDGGRTWRRARVAPVGHGRFRAAFTAPAKATVALRTMATDAGGGSISETITGAYLTG